MSILDKKKTKSEKTQKHSKLKNTKYQNVAYKQWRRQPKNLGGPKCFILGE